MSVDILIASAPGGHLSVAEELFNESKYNFVYIITSSKKENSKNKTEFIIESNRDFKIFLQFYFAFKFIVKYKPKCVISTGAGVAIPFLMIAKFFLIKTIFIESASRVKSLSLAGKLVYFFSDYFFVRSEQLKNKYSKVIYVK